MRQPPPGFVVVNAELWAANERLFTPSDLLDLADGGLRRIGLRKEREWLEEQGQASMAEMFGELEGGR